MTEYFNIDKEFNSQEEKDTYETTQLKKMGIVFFDEDLNIIPPSSPKINSAQFLYIRDEKAFKQFKKMYTGTVGYIKDTGIYYWDRNTWVSLVAAVSKIIMWVDTIQSKAKVEDERDE